MYPNFQAQNLLNFFTTDSVYNILLKDKSYTILRTTPPRVVISSLSRNDSPIYCVSGENRIDQQNVNVNTWSFGRHVFGYYISTYQFTHLSKTKPINLNKSIHNT